MKFSFATRVVRVGVSVHQEPDRRGRDLLYSSRDFVYQLSALRVDHEDAIGTREEADRAAIAVKLVEILSELCDLDLHFAIVAQYPPPERELERSPESHWM